MKKKILLGLILASSLTLAATNLENSFKQIEREYAVLLNKENTVYESKRVAAEKAQAALSKQQEMYNDVAARRQQLQEVKDVKFYKAEYSNIVKKLDIVLEKLEREMETHQKVISDFEKLRSIKEGR